MNASHGGLDYVEKEKLHYDDEVNLYDEKKLYQNGQYGVNIIRFPNVLEKDLKRKEDQLYLDQMRVDVAAEDAIDLIRGVDSIQFGLSPIFKIEIP